MIKSFIIDLCRLDFKELKMRTSKDFLDRLVAAIFILHFPLKCLHLALMALNSAFGFTILIC